MARRCLEVRLNRGAKGAENPARGAAEPARGANAAPHAEAALAPSSGTKPPGAGLGSEFGTARAAESGGVTTGNEFSGELAVGQGSGVFGCIRGDGFGCDGGGGGLRGAGDGRVQYVGGEGGS